jgi:hypothetical protein
MTHPGPEPAPTWQQPPIVLGSPVPVDGADPEPQLWAQPGDEAETATVAPLTSAIVSSPSTTVAVPESPGTRRLNAIFGRVPTPGIIVFSLVFWAVSVTFYVFQGAPVWFSVAGTLAFGIALVNLVRWLRHRH